MPSFLVLYHKLIVHVQRNVDTKIAVLFCVYS